MAVIAFTKRYVDRTTPEGFQFEFFCDRTRTGWEEVLNNSSDLLSTIYNELGLNPNTSKQAKKDFCTYSWVSPLQANPANVTGKFVEDAKKVLESDAIGAAGKVLNQAVSDKAKEVALTAAITQAKQHFRYCTECNRWVCKSGCWNNTTRLCKDCTPAPSAPMPLRCNYCGDQSTGGRFCATCGKALAITIFCGNCGAKIDGDKGFKFCPMCADPLDYIFGSK